MAKKHPDLNYLHYFYTVVKHNGFTRAAEVLKVQQPVVSRAIKLLEEDLGQKLLERQKKKTILTIEGKKLFEMAEKIFREVELIRDVLSGESDLIQGKFSLAGSDSLSFSLLKNLITGLSDAYPNLIFHHYAGSSTNYIASIQNGELDMGLFFNVPSLPQDLEKTKICDVDFCYVVKNESGLKSELKNSFIGHHEAPEKLPLFKKYKTKHKDAKVVIVSNSSMVRKSMVENGLGMSVLPYFMVQNEIKKKELVEVCEREKLALYLIERQSSYRTALKRKVISLVTNHIKN